MDWAQHGVKIVHSDELDLKYTTDVGHDARCCNNPRESRSKQVVGRHNGGSTGC
jgi:hypothetical protein